MNEEQKDPFDVTRKIQSAIEPVSETGGELGRTKGQIVDEAAFYRPSKDVPVVTENSTGSEHLLEKTFAFALNHGTDGIQVNYGQFHMIVTTMSFERFKFIRDDESYEILKSLVNQDPIPKITKVVPACFAAVEGTLDTVQLNWWGNVWLYWEVDERDCSLISCDLKDDDGVADDQIIELDDELHRGAEEPVAAVVRKYKLLIGSIADTPDSAIVQNVSSDVTWAVTFIPANWAEPTEIEVGGTGGGWTTVADDSDPTTRNQIHVTNMNPGAHDYVVVGNGNAGSRTIMDCNNNEIMSWGWQDGLNLDSDHVTVYMPSCDYLSMSFSGGGFSPSNMVAARKEAGEY